MSTFTPNYNLEKPASGDDFKNFTTSYGNNMDIIDEHLGQGGGGNVDDVLVNGVSVVDENHDAQITSYKEVTQAEYDALPATKLTDGIAYFIKDAGGGGGGSSSHNYSTTEQVIGTWIDKKPLYEITFSQTLNNIASGVATNMADISGLNIDEIADISGRVYYYNGADWFNVNLGTYFGAYAYPTGYLMFLQTMTAQTTDRTYKVAITLRYTKTTDV